MAGVEVGMKNRCERVCRKAAKRKAKEPNLKQSRQALKTIEKAPAVSLPRLFLIEDLSA